MQEATMAMQAIDEAEFEAQVLRATVPVLVDFSTSRCGPCRALMPVLRALAAEHAGRLEVRTVDAEVFRTLSARFDVRAFPTVIVFENGRERRRLSGLATKERLLRLLAA
jgi:thioredoxin 1